FQPFNKTNKVLENLTNSFDTINLKYDKKYDSIECNNEDEEYNNEKGNNEDKEYDSEEGNNKDKEYNNNEECNNEDEKFDSEDKEYNNEFIKIDFEEETNFLYPSQEITNIFSNDVAEEYAKLIIKHNLSQKAANNICQFFNKFSL
ncbi:16750_t:CDS:2, partial [Funneliformis caledonium]